MPYYSTQENVLSDAMKFNDGMEPENSTAFMDFHLNQAPPSEQLIRFENKPDNEIVDTMCATEIAVPYQEVFGQEEMGAMDYDDIAETEESTLEDEIANYEQEQEIPDIVIPLINNQSNFDQEIIAISDDEEEDMRMPSFLMKPSQRPLFPGFRQQRIPKQVPIMPMLPIPNVPRSSEVITLSDDEDDATKKNRKRKKSSRRRRTMFNPQICPFCRKEVRDNICMAKHLIKHHWHRIRAHNGGNQKGTDYFNLKDDREIPVDRLRDEKPYIAPLPPSLPPPLPPPPHNPFHSRDKFVIEQPLKPSFMREMRPSPFSHFPRTIDNGGILDTSSTLSSGDSMNLVSPALRADENAKARKDPSEDLGHPDNRELVKKQLSLLMHAHKCEGRSSNWKQNSFFQENKDCTLPECKSMKEVLKHLPSCQAGTDCPVPKCFISKQIVKWALSGQSPGVLVEMRNELNRQAKAGLPQEVIQWALKHPFDKEQWKSWRENKIPPVGPNPSKIGPPPLPTSSLAPVPVTVPVPLQTNSFLPRQPLSGTVINRVNPVSGTFTNTKPAPVRPNNPVSVALSQTNLGNAQLRQEEAKLESPNVTQPSEEKPISDWKKKYIEAAAKRRGNQIARKISVPQTQSEQKTDKVVPSKAPVDFLSGLLNKQEATAELRKVKRPEPIIDKRYQNVNKKQSTLNSGVKKATPAPPTTPMQAAKTGQEAAMYNSMLSL